MPRKTPLSDSERAIGQRVRAFREEQLISQTDFADALRVSRAQLINYEDGVSPLPWPVGRILFERFRVNPRWLVTGKPPKQLHRWGILRDPDPEKFTARAHFSAVYSAVWRDDIETATLNMVTLGATPGVKVEEGRQLNFRAAIRGWLERVPAARDREFFLELSTEAERIIAKLNPSDTGPRRH